MKSIKCHFVLHKHRIYFTIHKCYLWDIAVFVFQLCLRDSHCSVAGFTAVYMQLVPITTNVTSSNPAHGEVCSIQQYVIKFVSDLREVSGFFRYSVSSINKTDRHDITKKLLKVALSTTIITRMIVGFISSHVYH